jgi:hypothetical protein
MKISNLTDIFGSLVLYLITIRLFQNKGLMYSIQIIIDVRMFGIQFHIFSD